MHKVETHSDASLQIEVKVFRKIIAFADEEAAKSFTGGETWYARVKDNFNIEFVVVKISDSVREQLIKAQER